MAATAVVSEVPVGRRIAGVADGGLAVGQDDMKILLIEDDREAASYLIQALDEAGHVTHHASRRRDRLRHGVLAWTTTC